MNNVVLPPVDGTVLSPISRVRYELPTRAGIVRQNYPRAKIRRRLFFLRSLRYHLPGTELLPNEY